MSTERAKRIPTNASGTATWDGSDRIVVLRNRSSNGARLRSLRPLDWPDFFRLVVPLEKIDHQCQAVWRRGADVGVRFI